MTMILEPGLFNKHIHQEAELYTESIISTKCRALTGVIIPSSGVIRPSSLVKISLPVLAVANHASRLTPYFEVKIADDN